VIIGTSSEQQKLSDLVKGYGLKNVELTGELPMEKAVSYFHAAKIGLCPFLRNIHHDTTYANKLFQYMAFGLPVVVSDCTSQVNVVNRSSCGLIHEAGDARQLAEKILELDNGALYDKFSRNAREAVYKNYNFEVSKSKLVNLYKNLANEIQGTEKA
jgi:glycosyltransferase involved in cell wall biosynthesis